MKEYTSESIRLRANESLLNSKGFILFAVCQDGTVDIIGHTTELTCAERLGLEYSHRRWEPEDDKMHGQENI